VDQAPSGTVTLLFTDVERSTSLVRELGNLYGAMLAEHRALLLSAFEAHGGRIVDCQGDSFFVSFPRAHAAVDAAVEAQRALATHEWPNGAVVRVRMGLHTGEPEEHEGRYVGLDVHRAARIAAAGHGGQILLSSATSDLVEQDLPADMRLRDLGEQRLKDLDRPERIFQLVVEGLPSHFPALRTGVAEEPLRLSGRRAALVAAALAGALVAVAAAILVSVREPGAKAPARIEENAVAVIDGDTGAIERAEGTRSEPGATAAAEGAVWFVSPAEGTVSRVDPRSGATVQTVRVGRDAAGIAVGGGSVWAASRSEGTVSRVDLDTNQIVQTVELETGLGALAYGRGAVWVVNTRERTVSRIDAATGGVVGTIELRDAGKGVAADAGAVWVSHESAGTVSRIDPRARARIAEIRVGNGPAAIAASPGAVWVANGLDGTVSRIDPATGSVLATIPVGRGPNGIALGPETVWVANELSGTVSGIDPASNAVVHTIEVGGSPRGIAAYGDLILVPIRAVAGHQGGVLRVQVCELGLDSLDPAIAYTTVSWSVLSVTGDGLVAFKRVGGPDGATLVPDLAVSVPAPVDGRTYTFRLREGIRFSDGRQLRASDVRFSLERLFRAGSPRADLYAGIVGGAACLERPATCDLGRGVAVDDAAGTVTIRLRASDPEFLYKLALPFGYVVPSGTPSITDGGPVPSTGPYHVVGSRDRLRLVRNEYFSEWSKAARPAGYPDEIRFTSVPMSAASLRRGLEAVRRGAIDIAADLPPGSYEQLRTRYAGRVHELTLPTTMLLLLNTTLPPFDNLDARRALAFAVDRAAAGEGLVAEPTCQVLPPGFEGYEPYCPYTLAPGTGSWTAPDLATARRLAARSGTTGTPVTVWTTRHGDIRHWADTAASALRKLGYRVSLRFVPDEAYWATVDTGSHRIQIAPMQWFADYPTPSGFVATLFRCGAFGEYVCDPRVDATIERAVALQAEDPKRADVLWARLDRDLVDRALTVPILSGRGFFFVSRRLESFQHHPVFGILYDQAWVR
jgi:YVTN family beta-propeller protein